MNSLNMHRHARGTRTACAPETIRTSDLCLRSFTHIPTEQYKAVAAGGLSSIEGLRAPVAQLDRALPSEGKGRTSNRLGRATSSLCQLPSKLIASNPKPSRGRWCVGCRRRWYPRLLWQPTIWRVGESHNDNPRCDVGERMNVGRGLFRAWIVAVRSFGSQVQA